MKTRHKSVPMPLYAYMLAPLGHILSGLGLGLHVFPTSQWPFQHQQERRRVSRSRAESSHTHSFCGCESSRQHTKGDNQRCSAMLLFT
jgi:hypothetical protein